MSNPKQILALERFDSYLEPTELLNNATTLAEYLSKQNPPFPVDQIKPTMSYLIETRELMESNDDSFKLQLAISFVHAYRISSSIIDEQPINEEDEIHIDRLFKLLNDVFSKWDQSTDDREEIVSLIQITNRIGLYRLAVGCGLDGEIFSTLIKIDMPESVDNIAILINHSERIPSKILSGMCDLITKNKNVELLLLKISPKQIEFIQGIRSNYPESPGYECIQVFEKAASILKIPPPDLFDYIQNDINIENEDDQTRLAAFDLLTKTFLEAPFNPSDHECISMLISRNVDRDPKIRVLAVKFGFEELLKINNYKKSIKPNSNQNDDDVIKSVIKTIENDVWDMAQKRSIDRSSAEVRCATLKGISHLDAKDIKIAEERISERIKDSNREVREIALRVMLKLYDAKPNKHEWLIDQVIELYQISNSKDIALYGFSKLMSNHSLIEVASNITNRKPLLDILKDTNELRANLPEMSKSPESKEIVSKHTDVKKVSKLLKKVPKSFFEQALDYKKRKQLGKKLKEKIGSDSHLLLGLYQPSPFVVDDLLSCKELDVVHDLGKIFTYELEDEIPNLIKRCNKTDLTILATFKHYELDDEDRQKILKALIPQITSKKRNLALIAFAHVYRKNKTNDQLLSKIKFDKKEFTDKIMFYGHFVDSSAYPGKIYDEINDNIDLIDEKTVKYALKIAITENSQRSINTLMHFRELYPDVSFKYYLLAAQNRECYSYITPEVFREFAYVMQYPKDAEVRSNAIKYLTKAMQSYLTPIHFLALFALSALDPEADNQKEAKLQLESAVKFRRYLMKNAKEFNSQITPETAIPYLVYILAHHKDFDADLKSSDLGSFSIYLKFFLTPICSTTNQFSYIIELCTYYSFLDDVEEDYTENNKKLYNIAISIVRELGQGKEWAKNPIMPEIGHSERYYKASEDPHKLKESMKHSGVYLKSPSRPVQIHRAGMTTNTPRRSKLPDFDSDESESEKKKGKTKKISKPIKSAPATPKRKSSAQPTKSTRKSSVSVSALSTPKRASTKSKKKTDIENNDNDNDEESSSKKSPARKKRAASAANSPTASPRKATKVATTKKSSSKPSAKSSAKTSTKSSAKSSAKASATSTPKRKQTKPPTKTKNAKK